MTDNTQELREQILSYAERYRKMIVVPDSGDEYPQDDLADDIEALIQRKQIEARIDELEYIWTQGQRVIVPGLDDKPVWSSAFRDRLAELKQQLEGGGL